MNTSPMELGGVARNRITADKDSVWIIWRLSDVASRLEPETLPLLHTSPDSPIDKSLAHTVLA